MLKSDKLISTAIMKTDITGFTTIVGSQKFLRAHFKMDSDAIVNRILKHFGKI